MSEPVPVQPAGAVVARFTGEVDMGAGTFSVQVAPVSQGRPSLSPVAEGSVITVLQTSHWNGTQRGAGTCGNVPVTGGTIQLILQNTPGLALGMVYAQIDSVTGTSVPACNSTSPVPVGLSGTYGIWSYGQMWAGQATTVEWDFPTTGNARFGFSGTIRAVQAQIAQGTIPLMESNLADNGTNVVYGEYQTRSLFMVPTDLGALTEVKNVIPANSGWGGVATPAITPSRIWWGAYDRSGVGATIGVLTSTGAALGSAAADPVLSFILTLVVDPVSPDKVYFLQADYAGLSYLGWATQSGGIVTVHDRAASLGIEPGSSMAFDTDGRYLYVTGEGLIFAGERWIKRVDTQAMTVATVLDGTTLPAGCGNPELIVNGATGVFFFNSGSQICRLTLSPAPSVVNVGGMNSAVTGLAMGPDGYLWGSAEAVDTATPTISSTLKRFAPGEAANYEMVAPTPIYSLVRSNGYLFADSDPDYAASITRFKP